MGSHTYTCRICNEHKELHRSLSACSTCREKYSISDFEPTLKDQFMFILKILLISTLILTTMFYAA